MRRRLVCLMASWMLLTIFPLQAFAQEAAPKPPSLYSQAALLMDADTGQVLYGKNMDKKMYPASLTKMMTLLLAMERGNPADVVTMTDEGVFSVPRGTTHIALTTGEQLTMEQLTYAMMVESANDAANGIAIHMGGTIENFAQMMNERATEAGALNTHFTNSNGLPDDNHYTTAYDLGMITKAAYAHPDFTRLAGTKYYEIPPTNKQKNARKINNKQYMFCLNDTYDGAFAGKTGWTEEAGKTLITLAERDGVTLIAVVLKASGTVDAEFKDSTALLDYGYDNFTRVNVSKDKVSPVDLSADGGGTGILRMKQDMPVLLANGVTEDDLTIKVNRENPQNAWVELTVPSSVESMYPVAGRFSLAVEQPALPEVVDASAEPPDNGTWNTVLIWAGGVLLALLCALLIARQVLRARYRKRRLRRQRAISRIAQSNLPDVIDVTVNKGQKNKIEVLGKDKP